VHTDVEIAGFEKLQQPGTEDLKFLHAFRQKRGESALLLFQPGNVSVAEERDAVGCEFDDLIDSVRKRFRVLVRQAVDQVHVDAVEAERAGGANEIARNFVRLDAMDCLLDWFVEVLNAHAEAVEAEAAQGFQMFERGYARIDFNANFGFRLKA